MKYKVIWYYIYIYIYVIGALYAFPRIVLSDKLIAEAHRLGKEADMLYCLDMLEHTGILTVPGSGIYIYILYIYIYF